MTASNPSDRLALSDLLAGALKGVASTPKLLKGLWGLATIKPDSKRSIGVVIESWAARTPNAPALVFEGQTWSYAAFNAWANQIAHALRREGIGRGDAVALLIENRPLALAAVAAIVKLGAVAAMLNHQQRGEVLAHSLRLTDPKRVIVGGECAEAWRSADVDLPVIWEGEGAPVEALSLAAITNMTDIHNPSGVDEIPARSPCFYIFTSGTTGLPKASKMTHYRWLRGMAGLGQMGLRLSKDDRLYCCLPVYHNNALTVSWGAVLGAGATLVLARKFSASRFWEDIRHSGATAFCYIGELCRYLLNQPVSDRDRDHAVHSVIGNGLRPEIWVDFQSRFGITNVSEFYGASESNLAFVNGFNVQRTAGFCPMPFAVVAFDADEDMPVRDASGHLRKVPVGEVGLLITEVSERTPFDGYTDAKASEAKLLRDVFAPGDCWFNTGDLVRDQGFRHIQFVDRVGDTFRWKGENVATTEVEAVLTQFAGVEQAVVYGVTVPGADGRAGMAALTLTSAFDGEALARHLAEKLPAYAVPLFIRLRAEQSTTATFKYRKVELRRDGFDPRRSDEPIYLRWDASSGYVPLTEERLAVIEAGQWRS